MNINFSKITPHLTLRNALIGSAAVALLSVVSCTAFGADPQLTQAKPEFNLCTGGATGNYFFAGNVVKKNSTSVVVHVRESKGSIDNLDQIMEGKCDGAFVQTDALRVYGERNARSIAAVERSGALYKEYVHFVCNRDAKLGRITDLTDKHTVAIGPDGSGSRVMWEGFVLADKKRYGKVSTSHLGGLRALNAVSDGSQVTCMIFTGALNVPLLKNDALPLVDRIVLVPANDGDFDNAKDQRGKRIYHFEDIPSNTYGKLHPSALLGYKNVETTVIEAVFVVSNSWIEANERAYDNLIRSFNSSLPEIKNKVGQK